MEDMRLSQQDVERLEHEPTKEQPAAPSPIFGASANSLQPKTIAKSPKREMPTWAWAALLLGGALVLAGILYYIGRHNMQIRTNTTNTQDEKLIAAVTKDYFSISGAKVDPTEAAAEKLALPNKLTIDNTQGNGKLDCEESVGYENGTIPHEGVVCERSYAVDYGFNGAPDQAALQKIAAVFQANGWMYHPPLPGQTEASAIKEIADQYASGKKLDYTDVGYTKGLLYSHFRLATNNVSQPAGQNFCDVLCDTIHANKNKYLYFVGVYVQFKEYKYADGWQDPHGGY